MRKFEAMASVAGGDPEETMLKQSAAGIDPIGPNDVPAGPAPGLARKRIAGWLKSALNRWPRMMNIGLLVAGLGLGQGSIFVVQTLLVAAGQYELLAAFGTHYSFAVLGIILVDGGASTILARAVARLSNDGKSRDEIWRIFCETSAIRLLTALLICAGAAVYALGMTSDGFSRWYVAFAFPGLLFWAGNAVGLLDGLRLSGISGITGSAAYVLTAIGLALAAHRSAETAGSILGGAFSLGYLVTLGAQWIALGRKGWLPQYRKMTRTGLLRSLGDGGALLFQFLPGQLTMRAQLVLSSAFLGAETTALFIYAKQVVTASTQVVAFVMRVDFPGLVEKMAGSRERSLGSILNAQSATLYCAIAFTAGATIVAGIAVIVPDFHLHRAATILVAFAPTILTMSLLLMMTQALAALGAYAAIAGTSAVSAAMGILVGYLLVTTLDVYAFVLGEVTNHLVGFYLLYRYMRRRHR